MKPDLLILRPEPGASRTAAHARSLGLSAIAAPLFEIISVDWTPPDPALFDAVIVTSVHAARQAGPAISLYRTLPCYAVGDASAAAAAQAGFSEVIVGPSDGAALVAMMDEAGVANAFHPCGRDHIPLASSFRIEKRIVYAALAADRLPERAATALKGGAIALLHSPRAAHCFGQLLDQAGIERASVRLAAISPAAAEAAGEGWKNLSVADIPRDHALLELAASLCKTDRTSMESDG